MWRARPSISGFVHSGLHCSRASSDYTSHKTQKNKQQDKGQQKALRANNIFPTFEDDKDYFTCFLDT